MKPNVTIVFTVSVVVIFIVFTVIVLVTTPDKIIADNDRVVTIRDIKSSGEVREFLNQIIEEKNKIPPEPVISDKDLKRREKIENLRRDYNNDVVGHLRIENSTINYPVFQSSDNEYYLNRNHFGEYDVAGSIFLDFENDVRSIDKNTVIYGHNMNKDYMFHSLRYYQDWDYYQNHKYIFFDTYYESQVWEIFSFYKTDISFNYIKVFFASDDDFYNTLKEMKARSIYDTGVEVKKNDIVLTLSTCSNEESNTRYVVNAKRIR